MGLLGNQKNKYQVDRLAIDGIKIYRFVQLDQSPDHGLALSDATMGNSNAIAQTCAAKFFPGQQIVKELIGVKFRQILANKLGYSV